jgi:hypothetical protein
MINTALVGIWEGSTYSRTELIVLVVHKYGVDYSTCICGWLPTYVVDLTHNIIWAPHLFLP